METALVRACTNCVRAKARCSSSTSGDAQGKCERCCRMNKLCQPSPPMRRPAHRTWKKASAHDTSKLEEKLDGLVTLLKSASQGVPGINNPLPENPGLASRESAPRSIASSGAGYGENIRRIPSSSATGPPDCNCTSTLLSSPSPTQASSPNLQTLLDPALAPGPEEAELYLNKFRVDFVKHLPFIVISPSTTAHQLRLDRPILWISIMTVTSSNSTQQILLSKGLRGILAMEAFVDGTRNMDLLLAILVYTVWDRRFHSGKPILIGLVQLAIAILYDLGLDKPVSRDPALTLAYDLKGSVKPARFSRSPTMEERRVLLGCFLVSSVSFSSLQKGTGMRWTTYLNECLRIIEAEKEFESDALLVQLVKLRRISESLNDLSWSSAVAGTDTTIKAPAMFYLRSLESQLKDFKINIPSNLANNQTLLIELHTIELSIYEIGLSQAPDIFSGQPNRRIECLWACLNAIQSWVGVFLSIIPAQYVGFAAPIYSNMTHFFIAIYRLATFEHPEWDRSLLREHLDVSSFLDEAGKNFSRVKEDAGLDIGGSGDIDSFTAMASKFEVVKMSWAAQFTSTMELNSLSSTNKLYDFPMEFADEDWLRDWVGAWNE